MERQGRTFAKRENVRRRVRLRETWPFPMGVARGPFNAIVFFLTRKCENTGWKKKRDREGHLRRLPRLELQFCHLLEWALRQLVPT